MNINLREEETNEYISLYQNYLEDIQQLNKKVTDVLNEVMQQSRYDKLQHRISGIIDAYMDVIINKIENGLFVIWEGSEGSLRACLRTYKAGDAADGLCSQIEQKMSDLMKDILKIEKADWIETERPVVSEEGFERLTEICQNAKNEIHDIKDSYLNQVASKESDNDIYGTLKTLIESIAVNMEGFFEASLNSFTELHEFVKNVSSQMRNMEDDNSDTGGGSNNGQAGSEMGSMSSAVNNQNVSRVMEEFKNLTQRIYQMISDRTKRKLAFKLIRRLVSIYRKFYTNYGNILKDRFESVEEKEQFVRSEYISFLREKGLEQYFEGEEVWTFRSHARNTYTVWDRVADMVTNIATACENGQANNECLINGFRVLVNPILEGYISEEDSDQYATFSRTALNEIIEIINMAGLELSSPENHIQVNVELNFSGEEFSEENIRLAVMVIERMVEQVGVDELNTSVDRHYTVLNSRSECYVRQNIARRNREYTATENIYGRYTVTRKSIQIMEPLLEEANMIMEPMDRFYKEKFEALGSGFDKASTAIHAISSFLGLWGVGTWNLSKLFSVADSNATIFEKIQLGGVALASQTSAGKIINGGAHMMKVLDWAMPYMKTSKTLVKLSEKVWDLTGKDIQLPWIQRRMEQYVREHYELKYGMKNFSSMEFILFHEVVKTLDDIRYRRIYENACFAAEYIIFSRNDNESMDVRCGIYLNLVRSGMCSRENIESRMANEIVDKLYNQYVNVWRVVPKVEVNPYRGR